nr:ribonuclease H-like domain-containing protein [Tanacetum cinerariifolium]
FFMTDLRSLNYFLGVFVNRDTSGMFLSQQKYATEVLERADADWAGCPTTRQSTFGYCVFFGNNLLFWPSKRQFTISRSSAEAEYRGVANAVTENCWLRNILRELNTSLSTATLVYCDNVSAVYLSLNPVQHQRTKHIEIDIPFVRDLVSTGRIRVIHVPSHYQYADIFTKRLPSTLFDEFRSSLSKYATEVLEHAGMLTCNPCRTLVDPDSKLFADVQHVCLFMHDPREPHFSALKQILRYVRGTLSYGLQLYSSTISTLVAYSNANWAGCPTTPQSTSGYCVFFGNNLLFWPSKRQFTISRSSAEAEYRGVANAVTETCWLRNILRELHTSLSTANLVYCDYVSAVYLSSNPMQHQRTKHIEIDIPFVRDLVSTGRIRISSPKDYLQLYLTSFAPA